MKKILITGAGGYIGSVATYLFLQKGYEVVAIDNFTRGYRGPLELLQEKYGKHQLRYFDLDLTGDISPVFQAEKNIEAVIHYAAYCNVGESMKQPELYFSNNVHGVLNVVDAMSKNGIDKLIFSSTCAVYGESKYVPLDENHPISPISVYGESKLMAEKIIGWYGKLKGLRSVMLRYFNVCGASDDSLIGDSKHPSFHLMQNAIRAALKIAPFELVCPKVDTPDGTPIRDYVNVVDLNEAHVAALNYLMKGGESDVFNLGTGKGASVMEIIDEVKKNTGATFELNHGETRAGDPARLFASNNKIKTTLKWEPKRSIEDSVKTLIEWYKKNPNGWKS